MAEYEHQFKAIHEAQKTFVVREMMPRDLQREFLTGPREFDEIMEKLAIIMFEMMAYDGPGPVDLGNVGTHAKITQTDQDTSNDMSYEDVCGIVWKGHKASMGTGKKGANGSGVELMNGRVAEKMTEARKEARRDPRAANLTGTVAETKEALDAKARAKGKGKSEIRHSYGCGGRGHIGVNTVHTSAPTAQTKKRTKARRGRVSLKEKRQKNSRVWRHLMTKESGAGPEGTESPDGGSEWIQDQHSTTLLKMTRKSRCLED